MTELKSPFFTFSCDPERGSFSWLPADPAFPALHYARLVIESDRLGQRMNSFNSRWNVESELEETIFLPGLGSAASKRYCLAADSSGLCADITFAVIPGSPLFLWRMRLTNSGSIPLQIRRIELLRTGGQESTGKLVCATSTVEMGFYSNGWQSWSHTAAYKANQGMPYSHLGFLQVPMVYNSGTPRFHHPGYFTSDFFGVLTDRRQRTALLAGFLSQQQQFGTIEALLADTPSLRVWANGDMALLESGCSMETDWAVLMPFQMDDPHGINPYLDAVARFHAIGPVQEMPSGWCSWYHYYTNISADIIRENLAEIIQQNQRLPIDLVQIDDGFETQPGDWFSLKKVFPDGLAPLAKEIQAAGKTPGLWLAPFIVHPQSQLARQHRDWLLRGTKGGFPHAGFVWNSLPYGLDLTVPEALGYAQDVVRTAVQEWGFPYLKLDFLYAAALPGRYQDLTRTRAQVLRMGMEALREAAGPDTYLLGCGLPLGSALGLVQAMRIGADVNSAWNPRHMNLEFPFRQEVNMPSARNAIHNTLTRAPLHRHWWANDPDCLMVRKEQSRLTQAETHTLASVIALTGGALILSDDVTRLPADRQRIAEMLLPSIPQTAQVLDWLDETEPQRLRVDLEGQNGPWRLLAWFNWSEKKADWAFRPQDFRLPDGTYWLRSFWDGVTEVLESGAQTVFKNIPPHGCVVLAVRERIDGEAQYIGSNLHISQGMELAAWSPCPNGLDLRLALPRRADGIIELALPAHPVTAELNGQETGWQAVSPGRYAFNVDFDRQADLRIRW